MRNLALVLTGLVFLLPMGCMRGSPASPDSLPSDEGVYEFQDINPQSNSYSNAQLMGLWEVYIDPIEGTAEVVPLRGIAFSANVTKLIEKPYSNLLIKDIVVSHYPDYIDLTVDFGFRHPFPGIDQFTVFDVMGVFLGDGTDTSPGAGEYAVAGENDQQLLNPDGYTRWFNAPEFEAVGHVKPVFGYYPGAICDPEYVPSAILNPYKYFADGLDEDGNAFDFLVNNSGDRGSFGTASANYRRYDLRFPNDLILYFQYAFVAHWEPNVNYPEPPQGLDDFPESANSQEAVAINVIDSTDAFYVNESTYGGDIVLDITPWDWSASCSAAMEEYSIQLYSPAWSGPFMVDMTPAAQAEHHYTFHATIPGSLLVANGDQPVWIEVGYPGYDYSNPVGVPNDATGQLVAYFKIQVHILPYDPSVISDNFVYGFADCNFFEHADQEDNFVLFANMLNLNLEGPYAQNEKVLYYAGRSDISYDFHEFGQFVETLGYDWELIKHDPDAPVQFLDTTDVKMLMVATYLVHESIEPFSPGEIQAIKNLLNGGGICIIVFENSHCFFPPNDTHLIDQILSELHVDFLYPTLSLYETDPYIDFTPDPILEGVDSLSAGGSGEFTVFGEGVSLVRGFDEGTLYTTICKSPWKGD